MLELCALLKELLDIALELDIAFGLDTALELDCGIELEETAFADERAELILDRLVWELLPELELLLFVPTQADSVAAIRLIPTSLFMVFLV